MLNDIAIRAAFKSYLKTKSRKPKMVVEELRIHNGNSIADLVAVYESLHGFEIKGETDSIAKVAKQAIYYERSFPSVTLVTTKNHVRWASENLPEYWGVILAKPSADAVKFSYVRAAKTNPHFSRETSLLMLWKEELIEAAATIEKLKVVSSDSRASIAKKIAVHLPKNATAKLLSSTIHNRFHKLLHVNVMCDTSVAFNQEPGLPPFLGLIAEADERS